MNKTTISVTYKSYNNLLIPSSIHTIFIVPDKLRTHHYYIISICNCAKYISQLMTLDSLFIQSRLPLFSFMSLTCWRSQVSCCIGNLQSEFLSWWCHWTCSSGSISYKLQFSSYEQLDQTQPLSSLSAFIQHEALLHSVTLNWSTSSGEKVYLNHLFH